MTHDSRSSVCEIEARETRQKVDQFCRELRQTKQCNPEQLSFIETVCARVKHEAATGQDRGGAAETNTEALRWALHGRAGHGQIVRAEHIAAGLVRKMSWAGRQAKNFKSLHSKL